MSRIPIMNLDQIGIIKDIEPHDLPINAWSGGKNVRFKNGHVERFTGHTPVFTPAVDTQFALPVETPTGYFWLYVGGQQAYAYKDGVNNVATRASGNYNSSSGNVWTGGVLHGIPVLNNPNDIPQAWTIPAAGNRLVNLPNWNITWRARSMKPYKNYLVALGVSKAGVDNPWLVCWSDVTDPGTVPSTWDGSDPQNDAGDMILADSNGHLVDQYELGDANILYKSDCAYAMRHVGGIDIMGFKKVLKSDGLLMPNGVAMFSFRGDKHIVFGTNEIYVHDGYTAEPILSRRMRDWIYNNLDQNFMLQSFLTTNQDMKEVWICFPQNGQTRPNTALVWNYQDNTTTIRDLPSPTFITAGRITSAQAGDGGDTWGTITGTWATIKRKWGGTKYKALANRMLMFTTGAGRKAYLLDQGSLFDGVEYESYVERIGLSVLGKDPYSGKPLYESDQLKTVTEVWPRIKADRGVVIDIWLGSQVTEDSAIKWKGPFAFTAGVSKKINPYVTGRILSIRFAVRGARPWQLSGYDLEVIPGGQN
jgi:hypothetical protein